jgi:hypothetical protein
MTFFSSCAGHRTPRTPCPCRNRPRPQHFPEHISFIRHSSLPRTNHPQYCRLGARPPRLQHWFVNLIHSCYVVEVFSRPACSAALVVDVGVVVTLCLQLRTRAARRAPGSRAIKILAIFALQRGILQTLVQAGELLAVSPLNVHVRAKGLRWRWSTPSTLKVSTSSRSMSYSHEVRRRHPYLFIN